MELQPLSAKEPILLKALDKPGPRGKMPFNVKDLIFTTNYLTINNKYLLRQMEDQKSTL